MGNNKLILSEDGSHTLYSENFGTSYHSTHGAITESLHVFIEAGLKPLINKLKSIRILEMGFGTGLNPLLSYIEAEKHEQKMEYLGYEAYPISFDESQKLNYIELLKDNSLKEIFDKMHQSDSRSQILLGTHFYFEKIYDQIENIDQSLKFDLIYYDAFGPGTQEELWNQKSTDRMAQLLSVNGVLITYCAQGQFKRNLKSSGFEVEGLAGPPGKREITRAIKTK